MKSYVGHNVSVPRDWALFAGCESHVSQVQVLVRAESKADVTALYEEVQNVSDASGWFAKSVRLAGGGHYHLGDGWEQVLDSGVADERGIYVARSHVRSSRVVRIEPDGTGVVLGLWTLDGRRLTFTPTEPEPEPRR